jgi:hypothetical protein
LSRILVNLGIISGPLLSLKDSWCAYLDYHFDVHPTLIMLGRFTVQRGQRWLFDAEGWTRVFDASVEIFRPEKLLH